MICLKRAEKEAVAPLSDLGRRLSLEPATLSPLLKRLEANGMITRQRDPQDERALAISLTSQGRRTRAQAERIPGAVPQRLGMTLADLEHLRDDFNRLIGASGGRQDLS